MWKSLKHIIFSKKEKNKYQEIYGHSLMAKCIFYGCDGN